MTTQPPIPFWQPIAKCPKQDIKAYLLVQHGLKLGSRVKIGTYYQTKDCWLLADGSTPYDGHDLTHFAEIPPLPDDDMKLTSKQISALLAVKEGRVYQTTGRSPHIEGGKPTVIGRLLSTDLIKWQRDDNDKTTAILTTGGIAALIVNT